MGMLDGRAAIITGASKGIGRALALRFGREGAGVICAARSADLVMLNGALPLRVSQGARGPVHRPS